jgi:glycosyltransferase involved in cell wall biosynthesis
MPDIFEFVTHAQHLALTMTHEIWVHSLFGLVKLLGESTLQASRFPKIRVCRHPEPRATAAPAPRTDDGVFRIGVFGYVTAPKRITSVIRGLALACDRLGAVAKSIELVVVGRIPQDTIYDPEGEAMRFDVGGQVRFVDYPSADEFSRLQSGCDLIFNLRYPSCGESSGTLASAAASGAAVVTSRYQAFHEAPGDRTVTVLPVFEDWMIASVISDAFLDRSAVTRQAKHRGQSPAPVEKLLLAEILGRAGQRNTQVELS